jgi:hypothetical protein
LGDLIIIFRTPSEIEANIIQGLLEKPLKLGARNYITLREFSVSIPRIHGSANAAHNPLSRVAAKMQNEIANAV